MVSRDENVYSLIKLQLENHSMNLPFFAGWIVNFGSRIIENNSDVNSIMGCNHLIRFDDISPTHLLVSYLMSAYDLFPLVP